VRTRRGLCLYRSYTIYLYRSYTIYLYRSYTYTGVIPYTYTGVIPYTYTDLIYTRVIPIQELYLLFHFHYKRETTFNIKEVYFCTDLGYSVMVRTPAELARRRHPLYIVNLSYKLGLYFCTDLGYSVMVRTPAELARRRHPLYIVNLSYKLGLYFSLKRETGLIPFLSLLYF
jgi:hypothetical protein